MRRRAGPGSTAAWVLVAVLAFAGAGGPPRAMADETIAQALLESGRSAFKKKDYDEAAKLFAKALSENFALIEACYWQAYALDKAERPTEALAVYRRFLEMYADKAEGGSPTKEETSLRDKAEKRVAVLAAGELELKKLGDGFEKDLMEFAKRNGSTDKWASLRALGLLVRLRPDHDAARELIVSLGGQAPAAPEPEALRDPFAGLAVARWIDFLELKNLKVSDVTRQEGSEVIVDLEGGSVFWLADASRSAERFVLEMEFKPLHEYTRGWLSGWCFGGDTENFTLAVAMRSDVELSRSSPGGGHTQLAGNPMPPMAMDAWHSLCLRCEGRKVTVWFDGKKSIEHEFAEGWVGAGQVGVFHQRARIRYRKLRMGVLE